MTDEELREQCRMAAVEMHPDCDDSEPRYSLGYVQQQRQHAYAAALYAERSKPKAIPQDVLDAAKRYGQQAIEPYAP